MKRDEAFELAIQWRDDPTLLVGDLRAAMNWLWQNSDEATDAVSRAVGIRTIDAGLRDEAIALLLPLHKALAKYTVLIKTTKLTPDLLVLVIDSLDPAADGERHVVFSMRWIERREEPPCRRHHVERHPFSERRVGPGGERAVVDGLDRDAQPRVVDAGADRI